jgi:dihydropyrimidinase
MSSDHAPYRFGDSDGKAVHGTGAAFPKIPNGMPGLETCLPLVFSEGVLRGRLTLEQFVAVSATNAARIYGLYPRKGVIAPGADADLAIWDPSLHVTISNERLHHAMDYTPYEGMTVTGWPVVTMSRGDVVWSYPEFDATPGRGVFLPCERFDAGRVPRDQRAPAAIGSAS